MPSDPGAMGLVVYLASTKPLSHRGYDRRDPAPSLADSGGESLRRVRRRLSLPHIYEVRSSQGCGCGFLTDGEVGDGLEQVRAEYGALIQFVDQALAMGPEAELFSSWVGEEDDEPVEHLELDRRELDRLEFEHDKRHYVRVRRSEGALLESSTDV